MSPERVDALLQMVGDLQQAVGVLQGTASATLVEAKRTNGRVTAHDARLAAVERMLAMDEVRAQDGRDQDREEARAAERRSDARRWRLAVAAGVAGAVLGGSAGALLHALGVG